MRLLPDNYCGVDAFATGILDPRNPGDDNASTEFYGRPVKASILKITRHFGKLNALILYTITRHAKAPLVKCLTMPIDMTVSIPKGNKSRLSDSYPILETPVGATIKAT